MTAPTPSVQFAWDGPGANGAGQDGLALLWSQAQGKFVMGAAGVTDHGALGGLADDDHAQYALADGSRGSFAATGHSHSLDNLSDVAITTPASAQVVRYNGSGWVNAALAYTDLSGSPPAADLSAAVILAPGASARNVVQPSNAAYIPLTVKGAAGQTANLQEWQSSTGTVLAKVTSAGYVHTDRVYVYPTAYLATGQAGDIRMIGEGGAYVRARYDVTIGSGNTVLLMANTTAGTVVSAPGAAIAPLTVKGADSQTANLQEWQKSDGTVYQAVGPTGQHKTGQTAANTNTPSGATARQWPIYDTAGTLLGYVPIYASAW